MKRRHNEGAVLLTAIVLLAVLGLGAASVWSMLHRSLDAVNSRQRTETVRYLAEAGLEHARAALQDGAAVADAGRVALGDGYYTVAVQPLAAGTFAIQSTGAIADGALVLKRLQLDARLRLAEDGSILAYTVEEMRR